MPTGTTADQSVVNVWKTGSIGVGDSTMSSFRNSSAYGGVTNGAPTGAIGVDQSIVDLMNSPAEEIARYSNLLKGAKYLKSASKKYNKTFGDAFIKARDEWQVEATRTNRPELTFEQFLVENAQTGGSAKNLPTDYQSISGKTTAQNLITDAWKRELGREPTAQELATYTKKLQKAQAKNPSKQTFEIVNGKRVQKTITGLDEVQYLTNQARKLPEYSKKTAEEARINEANKQLSLQVLARTAAANGLNLQTSFGNSVQDWANRIANGENIEVFKGIIRQTAKRGLPDSVGALLDQGVDLDAVYEPYKRIMASVLEVNPETISLNDPTLRAAIGPDKEKTLYDFQRELRKDPRWQYTNNAREEVSTAALGILRDFGFQG